MQPSTEPGSSHVVSSAVWSVPRQARKAGRTLLQKMEAKNDYEQLLACLCTKSPKEVVKTLLETFWLVSCRDYENTLEEVGS